MSEFYCRSAEDRIAALVALRGADRDISELLDDIADGCGGCERASFGTPDGLTRWVSVIVSDRQFTTYASIVVDQGHGNIDGNATILRTTFGTIPWNGMDAEDSHRRYAEFATMCDDTEDDDPPSANRFPNNEE